MICDGDSKSYSVIQNSMVFVTYATKMKNYTNLQTNRKLAKNGGVVIEKLKKYYKKAIQKQRHKGHLKCTSQGTL